MTKSVRIENADNSAYTVTVETWQKGRDGAPDTLVKSEPLSYPTAMLTCGIHGNQYLVIKEG